MADDVLMAQGPVRWRPMRAGIFNIWEYDDQVFEFGDGRLVLRGRNGSGKSNALALLFPFLLDGVMSAARMDPMGGARSMKSLLLGRDDDSTTGRYRHDSGTGYAWMEFADRAGNHLTIGVGATATQQRDADSWFFLTSQRVGFDLDLADADVPKSRRRLAESIEGGEVLTTADEYRAAVDRALFGLGPGRYRTLVDLLLTLRRPHLAGKLDTEHLSATLSAGLAEIDPALVDDVAHSFDDLDAMQHELEGMAQALDAVERFLPVYRDHLIGIARARATGVLSAHSEHRRVGRDRSAADRERTAAIAERVDQVAEIETVEARRLMLDVEIETIQTSPAYRSAAALAEAEGRADDARRAATMMDEAAASAAGHAGEAERSSDEAARRHDRAEGAFSALLERWINSVRSVGIEWSAVRPETFDSDRATALVAERRAEVDIVTTAALRSDEAAAEARRRSAIRDEAGASVTEAEVERRWAQEQVTAARSDLALGRRVWAAEADLLFDRAAHSADGFDPARPTILLDDEGEPFGDDSGEVHADESGDLDADPAIALAVHFDRLLANADGVLHRACERTDDEIARQRSRVDDLTAERERVVDEPNPGPPPNPTRPDAAAAATGAPLYVCVDFAPSVGAGERAGFEASLAAAGVLDARIRPDDDPSSTLDAELRASTRAGGPTLADLLVPVPTGDLTAARITEVLTAIPIDGDSVRLGADGTWRLGPLAGRFAQSVPMYVGHEARERRRAERLAQLDDQLSVERSALGELERRLDGLQRVRAEIDERRTSQPSTAVLREALLVATAASTVERERVERLEVAESAASVAATGAANASADLQRQAVALRLPAGVDDLESSRRELARCNVQIGGLVSAAESVADAALQVRTAGETAQHTRDDADEARARATRSAVHAAAALERYERLRRDVGGDAQQAVDDLAEARERRTAVDERMAALQVARRENEAAIARLGERIEQLTDRERRLATERDGATARFLPICSAEVSEALAVDSVTPEADLLVAARSVLAETDEVPDDATNKMERAYREIILDGLRAGHDPSMPKLDGFDVIRVGTVDGEVALGALAIRLRADNERLSGLLSTKEREIFEMHLLTSVGDAIRGLLLEADRFEHDINAEMSKAPTASGMTVELAWEVSGDEPGLRAAVADLRYAPEMLGPERREALRAFFVQRIADVRADDPGRSFTEILTVALDYRSWHRFSLFARFADGKRQRVTRTFYRGLSGGEAATLLHLPLFAAAAAQYSGGTVEGPRLIALDEGFAGIDDQMRGRLMGLLTQLDLDVFVTSHEFWGFYEQVPNLVVYDLTRKPPTPGVYAQRFDWTSVPS